MRAVVATVSLNDAIGEGRGQIENKVAERMQTILDAYRSGVFIQGIAIRQADPPEAVNEAFKKVTAAQQDAQSYINRANAYSLQLTQKAQGEATAFDKVYEQYKLAPEVTRRRMKVCLAGGTLSYKDWELTLHRHGKPEQVWMNLDYSPILDGHGRPAGVVAFVIETTERVSMTLAPEAPYPACVQDANYAVRWLKTKAASC